jgi:hypothetical protein
MASRWTHAEWRPRPASPSPCDVRRWEAFRSVRSAAEKTTLCCFRVIGDVRALGGEELLCDDLPVDITGWDPYRDWDSVSG